MVCLGTHEHLQAGQNGVRKDVFFGTSYEDVEGPRKGVRGM